MYAELIRSVSEPYGPGCWNTIYTADVCVCWEYIERIRRRLQSEMPAHWDPLHPWGAIFQRASSQSDVEIQAFWNREVANMSLFFVAQ
eukprot:1010126-Alexandrium_andersonii.AAC.1